MILLDIPKPKYGAPCNNCGQCCQDAVCPLGQRLFKRKSGPCPALQIAGAAHTCGLVANPERYWPAQSARVGADAMRDGAALLVGAGRGCDALGLLESPDPEIRESFIASVTATPPAQRAKARKAWGIE